MCVVVFIGSNLDDVVLAMQVQRYPVIHVLRENIKMKKAAAAARDVALAPCHFLMFFLRVAWKLMVNGLQGPPNQPPHLFSWNLVHLTRSWWFMSHSSGQIIATKNRQTARHHQIVREYPSPKCPS